MNAPIATPAVLEADDRTAAGNANSSVTMPPSATIPWLRTEALAIGLLATLAFAWTGTSWWLFAALILVPDAFMVGYLANPRTGAAIYNVGHGYALPAVFAVMGSVVGSSLLLAIAAIWIAHIGFDRALGYGLKHPMGFKHTHLGCL